jgi:hypothetical protein
MILKIGMMVWGALCVFWTTGNAQDFQVMTSKAPDMTFQQGEVGDIYSGFKFVPPEGWVVRNTPEGYLIGSNTKPGFIVVFLHGHNTLAQLYEGAQAGVHDAGNILTLASEIQPFETHGIAALYTGTMDGIQASAYSIGLLSTHGGGVVILAATKFELFDESYIYLAQSIARSVVFFKPKAPAELNAWAERLDQVRLTHLWRYGSSSGAGGAYVGGGQKIVIDLCRQGYFNYLSQSDFSADGGLGTSGYTSGNNKGKGAWEVTHRGQKPILRLKFHEGNIYEYVLSMQAGKVYLDDKQYIITGADAYLMEHRPQCD